MVGLKSNKLAQKWNAAVGEQFIEQLCAEIAKTLAPDLETTYTKQMQRLKLIKSLTLPQTVYETSKQDIAVWALRKARSLLPDGYSSVPPATE